MMVRGMRCIRGGKGKKRRDARSHQRPEGCLAGRCRWTALNLILTSARCLWYTELTLSGVSEICLPKQDGMKERPTWIVHGRSVRDRVCNASACIQEAYIP